MTESVRETTSASPLEIEAQAADFLHRRRVQRWTADDQAELDAWLAEATAHRVAYLRLEDGEIRVERIADFDPRELDKMRPKRRRSYTIPLLAIAASLIAAAGIGFAVEQLLQPPADRSYGTDVGGRALLSFGDRTQIELDTNTLVRFRMTNHQRIVWLEHGEAWFHVAHDAANPFTVVIGKHRVTDLGTEFLVRRGANGVEVALLSGRAAFSTEGAQTATLRPGDEAMATPNLMYVTHKSAQELADELSWRRGVLVFRNTTLADAVREFNRYNTTKLVIADPSIAGLKFSAELRTDHFEGFLQLAEQVLKLRVDREGNDIFISRGERDETKRIGHKHVRAGAP